MAPDRGDNSAHTSPLLEENTLSFSASSFGLDPRLLKAVERLGYVYPTLVQSKAIPLALQGKDLLVRARTGSGKTAAFALPTVHKILQSNSNSSAADTGVLAIILVPTRELCDQSCRFLWHLTRYCRDAVSTQALTDDNLRAQQALLRDPPDILISTPSRLLFHLRAGNVKLSSVQTLIMDEADLILSLGYDEDVKAVIRHLPRIYQGILMSATLSTELDSLKKVVLHSPAILRLEEAEGGDGLLQFHVVLPEHDKFLLLYVFLKLGVLEGKGLFFVNTIDACYRLRLFLEQFSIRSAVLNAELPLNSRLQTLQEYNRGIFDYLIATDQSAEACSEDYKGNSSKRPEEQSAAPDKTQEIDNICEDEGTDTESEIEKSSHSSKSSHTKATSEALRQQLTRTEQQNEGDAELRRRSRRVLAQQGGYGVHRGIDFHAVGFVVNVDFPASAQAYMHRVGRTARGTANGTVLSLIRANSEADHNALAQVQATQPALPALEGDHGLSQVSNAESASRQPAPLAFDLRELEGFRYRVEDVKRAVTKIAVREARLAEIRQQLLNSDALKQHFQENPQDFRVLRQDKTLLSADRVQQHLKHVPDYLLPEGMQVGQDSARKRRKRKRAGLRQRQGQSDAKRRKDNDPLQGFQGQEVEGQEPTMPSRRVGHEEEMKHLIKPPEEDRIYWMGERLGRSTANRVEWQRKRRLGRFRREAAGKKHKRR